MNLTSLLACLLLFSGLPVKDSSRWVVGKSSSLAISGRTNISSFSCGIPGYTGPDTITFVESGQRLTLQGVMRLPIAGFDCHNKLMTADLRKTLHAAQYPDITIRFIDLDQLPGTKNTQGTVEITLAGISKTFRIDYRIQQTETGSVTLTGTRDICFTDFGLTPPSKMCGLVKVNDALTILFILNLKKVVNPCYPKQ